MNEETGYCLGCHRTLREIGEWDQYDDTQKQAIITTLASRVPENSGH